MTDHKKNTNEYRDFDHHSVDHRVGAECKWAKMRDMPTLPYSEKHGGFHIVTKYKDLKEVTNNWKTYSSASGIALPDEDRTGHVPAEVDPPLQKEYRALIMPFLGMKQVAEMEAAVRQQAIDLLDTFDGKTHIDFVEYFAKPFPILVSLKLFGFPLEDAGKLDVMINQMIDCRGTNEGAQASDDLTAYIVDFLEKKARVAQNPKDDIMSAVVLGEVEGRKLTMEEKISMTRLFLFGGFTTVTIALSSTFHLFTQRPDIVQQLRDKPELLHTAVDEFIRLASPATYLRRTVTQETELGGSTLCPGEFVLVSFAAANLDPETFGDDDIVLDRKVNPHVAFGHGPHRCMGSLVAKLEMRTAIEEILKRYVKLELDENQALEWENGETQGISKLPMILTSY